MKKTLPIALAAAMFAASASATPVAQKVRYVNGKEVPASVEKRVNANLAQGALLQDDPAVARRSIGRFGASADLGGTALRNKQALKSATSASRRVVAPNIDLRGVIVASDNSTPYGLYRIPTTDGGEFTQLVAFVNSLDYGVIDNGQGTLAGYYRTFDYDYYMEIPYLCLYDTETWDWLSNDYVYPAQNILSKFSALDPVTGKVYGLYFDSEDYTGSNPTFWGYSSFAGSSSTKVADLDRTLAAIGVDNAGQFYALDTSGMLCKLDKNTGAIEEIGPTGVTSSYSTGGCVNNKNNTFLFAVCNTDGSSLYEIDLTTAEAVKLCDFGGGEWLRSLYIAAAAADDKAPAAPELTASCSEGSMTVDFTVTLPSTLFDGTPVQDETFTYTISSNGQPVATGSGLSGTTVSASATMTASGDTEFSVVCTNATGDSPAATANCYVGKGTPAAPTHVGLSWADGTATVAWAAVTESADGGYLNPAEVTYNVLDPDGNTVGTGITGTTFSFPLAEPQGQAKSLTCSVQAVYDGKMSAPGVSNAISLGSYTAPFFMDLDQLDFKERFAEHTFLDANGDGSTWCIDNGNVCYKWNTRNAADDWLFSPAVMLEAGKAYPFKATVKPYSSTYPERIEIKGGNAATVAGMTATIVGSTVLNNQMELTGVIVPEADGAYYVGFHAISDPDVYRLILLNYSIDAPMAAAIPGVVTDMTITPDPTQQPKAEISFNAPAVDASGSPLNGNVTVSVLRGEDEVETAEELQPGQEHTFTDNLPASGNYTYSFIAANADGESVAVTASAYIGARPPYDVREASMSLTAPNTLTLTWEPVTLDLSGNDLIPANVSYNIYSVEVSHMGQLLPGEKLNTEPVTATTYTYTGQLPSEQDFFYLAIQSVNVDAVGNPVAVSCLVGDPYEMPVTYTGQGSLDRFLGFNGEVALGNRENMNVDAFDGDDSFYVFQNSVYGDATLIMTGMISISGENPTLSFYEYAIEGSENTTQVAVISGDNEDIIKTYTNDELPETDTWNRVKADLSAYKGQVVQIVIASYAENKLYNMYDCVQILDLPPYDVAAAITAPASVVAGLEFPIDVKVMNLGAEDAPALTVEILRNGEVVDTKPLEALISGASAAVSFNQTINAAENSAVFSAKVDWTADLVQDNNTSADAEVTVAKSYLPKVEGLTGQRTTDGISLSWDAIDPSTFPADPVTEDFESATAWEHSFGDWTFVDVDGKPVGAISGATLPGIVGNQTTASFFVFDISDPQLNSTFNTHSGHLLLTSLYCADGGVADDWLISPELSGLPQLVTFWARSYHTSYHEKIEIYYSENSTDPADFTLLQEAIELPAAWMPYSVELPAGARHFAIRSCAQDAFMLMIDDITYAPAEGPSSLQLKGYNLYRDSRQVSPLLAQPTFLDTEADETAHTYHVTALFDRGESELSEPLDIAQGSGIAGVEASAMKVDVEGSDIVVSNAPLQAVTIVAADGKVLHKALGDTRCTVLPGVYLVTVGSDTVKVAVK